MAGIENRFAPNNFDEDVSAEIPKQRPTPTERPVPPELQARIDFLENEVLVLKHRFVAESLSDAERAIVRKNLVRLIGEINVPITSESDIDDNWVNSLNATPDSELGKALAKAEKSANTPERKGFMESLKNVYEGAKKAINETFWENGKLKLAVALQKMAEKTGNWFKGRFDWLKRKGNEAVEFGKNTWETVKERVGDGEAAREMLEKIGDLLSKDSDQRDQLIALGVNVTTALFKLNPVGVGFSAASKILMDARSINRAIKDKRLGNYVADRFQQGTNADASAQKRGEWKAQEFYDKYQALMDEFKNESEGLSDEEIEELGQSPKYKVMYDEGIKIFNEHGSSQSEEETNENALKRNGKLLLTFARFGARGIAIYSNIFKKVLVGAQANGRTIEAYMQKNVEGGVGGSVEDTQQAIGELIGKLKPEYITKMLGGSKKEQAQLKKELQDVRDLMMALTDLGIIGDVIPRNIGHKQINGFLNSELVNKLSRGMARKMAGTESIIRDPQNLAQLRDFMTDKLAGLNDTLSHLNDYKGLDAKAVNDIVAVSGKDFLHKRQREFAYRMTMADVIGMFANAGVIYAGTHLEEAGRSFNQLTAIGKHEWDLTFGGQSVDVNSAPTAEGLKNSDISNMENTSSNGLGDAPTQPSAETTRPVATETQTPSGNSPQVSETNTGGDGPQPDVDPGDFRTDGPTPAAQVDGSESVLQTPVTPETANIPSPEDGVLNLGGGRMVDYLDSEGRLYVSPEGYVRGIDLSNNNNFTFDGGAGFLNGRGNSIWGVLERDLSQLPDTVPNPNAIINYTLLPLAKELGTTFTQGELASIVEAANAGQSVEQIAQTIRDARALPGN